MAKSLDSSKKSSPNEDPTPTPPAQHIWLAGLGAMAKAQEQGTKAIEALVNDGLEFQRKSQAQAQQRLHEATERLTHLASDFGQQATGRVDRLEHLFEDRVAKALHRLGMPTLQDIQQLQERVARLEAQLAQLQPAREDRSRKAPAPETASGRSKATASAAKPSTAAKSAKPKVAATRSARRPAG